MIRCHSERSEAATQPPKAFGVRPGFQSLIVVAALWAAQTLRTAKRLQQSAAPLQIIADSLSGRGARCSRLAIGALLLRRLARCLTCTFLGLVVRLSSSSSCCLACAIHSLLRFIDDRLTGFFCLLTYGLRSLFCFPANRFSSLLCFLSCRLDAL